MRPLQLIDNNNDIINLTELGQLIQKFCRSNISIINNYKNCGWLDGGCYALAHALSSFFNHLGFESNIKCAGRAGNQDHAVVCLIHPTHGVVYIDADGLANEEDIITKMVFLEECFGSIIEDYWKVFDEDALASLILNKLLKNRKLNDYLCELSLEPICA